MLPDPSPIVWACVENGFYVGNRAGDFIGYVDSLDDGHHAFDQHAQHLGTFDQLTEAMARVSADRSTSTEMASGVAS